MSTHTQETSKPGTLTVKIQMPDGSTRVRRFVDWNGRMVEIISPYEVEDEKEVA
jgi:hypothetical protein